MAKPRVQLSSEQEEIIKGLHIDFPKDREVKLLYDYLIEKKPIEEVVKSLYKKSGEKKSSLARRCQRIAKKYSQEKRIEFDNDTVENQILQVWLETYPDPDLFDDRGNRMGEYRNWSASEMKRAIDEHGIQKWYTDYAKGSFKFNNEYTIEQCQKAIRKYIDLQKRELPVGYPEYCKLSFERPSKSKTQNLRNMNSRFNKPHCGKIGTYKIVKEIKYSVIRNSKIQSRKEIDINFLEYDGKYPHYKKERKIRYATGIAWLRSLIETKENELPEFHEEYKELVNFIKEGHTIPWGKRERVVSSEELEEYSDKELYIIIGDVCCILEESVASAYIVKHWEDKAKCMGYCDFSKKRRFW